MLAALLFCFALVVPASLYAGFCSIYNWLFFDLPERRRLSRALRMEFRY